jgi:hypothetical protein
MGFVNLCGRPIDGRTERLEAEVDGLFCPVHRMVVMGGQYSDS